MALEYSDKLRKTADQLARIAGAVVFVAGLFLLLYSGTARYPERTPRSLVERTVVEEVESNSENGREGNGRTQRIKRSETEISSTPSRGLVREAFENPGGIILFRVGLAALAAFIAGAFVQRLVLARFLLKLGPGGVELEPLTEAGKDLSERIAELEEGVEKAQEAIQSLR